MAIDPNILLQNASPDIGQALLRGFNMGEAIRKQREEAALQPLRQQVLEAQVAALPQEARQREQENQLRQMKLDASINHALALRVQSDLDSNNFAGIESTVNRYKDLVDPAVYQGVMGAVQAGNAPALQSMIGSAKEEYYAMYPTARPPAPKEQKTSIQPGINPNTGKPAFFKIVDGQNVGVVEGIQPIPERGTTPKVTIQQGVNPNTGKPAFFRLTDGQNPVIIEGMQPTPEKGIQPKTTIQQGVDASGNPVFFSLTDGQNPEVIPGFAPTPKATTAEPDKAAFINAVSKLNADQSVKDNLIDLWGVDSKRATSALASTMGFGSKGITIDKYGNVTIGGPAEGLSKPSITKIEQKLISAEQAAGSLADIKASYDPAFLTIPGDIRLKFLRGQSLMGFNLSPEQEQAIGKRRVFEESVNSYFNAYRQQVTGAQASFAELQNLKKALLNTDLSAPEFEASFNRLVAESNRLSRIYQNVLSKGISEDTGKFDLETLKLFRPGLNRTPAERASELLKSGMSREQVKSKLIEEGYKQAGM